MNAGDRSITNTPRSIKFLRPSQPRKLRAREQVAAVCYRIGGGGIQFLLVQTRKGRWTFPKGGVEPGLTHAQTAALEAFEEAGVHGRMEEESFTRYVRHKRNDLGRSASREIAVHAHLCEVLRLGPPQEAERSPAWFSPEKAKRRLQAARTRDDGAEFVRVVDRAVARIQRSNNPACPASDPLQKVHFETSPDAGIHTRVEAALFSYIRRRGSVWRPPVIEFAANAQRGKIPQFGPARVGSQRLLEEHTSDYGTDRARVPETKTAGTGKKNRRS